MTQPLALSVIVPAYQCADMLRASLAGLLASDLPRSQWELIVVDDNSSDNTPSVAREVADHVLVAAQGPRGPAFARNLGAEIASAPVLLFVDSDVVVAPHTLSGFVHAFEAHPTVAAIFGAYDVSPGYSGFVSQYRNLLHHYVHLTHTGDASTFWAGCGAVRRDAFLQVGGYDSRRYPRPQIEDIEFGYRLTNNGYRILLDPELQGTHLKRWTFSGMLRTDFRDRAVPWMYLLMERGESMTNGPLNLRGKEKALTLLSGVVLLVLLASVVFRDGRWLLAAAMATGAIVFSNAAMFWWFATVRGRWFALRVIPMRLMFYVTSGLGALWAIMTYRWAPRYATLPPLHSAGDGFLAA